MPIQTEIKINPTGFVQLQDLFCIEDFMAVNDILNGMANPRIARTELRTRPITTPLGPMIAGSIEENGTRSLCLLEFASRPALPRSMNDLETPFNTIARPDNPDAPCATLDETHSQLREYFAGGRTDFDLPLLTPGTDFQQRVWGELRRIPFGTTISYSQLADRVGSPGAQRAVGAANGRNRIAVIIPCHRVIESTGALRGYGGGLPNKKWLLDHERCLANPDANTLFDLASHTTPTSPLAASGRASS